MEQDEPKRNIEAHSIYDQERKIELQNENPDLEISEIDKMICAEWNALNGEKNEFYIDKAEAVSKKIQMKRKYMMFKICKEEKKWVIIKFQIIKKIMG